MQTKGNVHLRTLASERAKAPVYGRATQTELEHSVTKMVFSLQTCQCCHQNLLRLHLETIREMSLRSSFWHSRSSWSQTPSSLLLLIVSWRSPAQYLMELLHILFFSNSKLVPCDATRRMHFTSWPVEAFWGSLSPSGCIPSAGEFVWWQEKQLCCRIWHRPELFCQSDCSWTGPEKINENTR